MSIKRYIVKETPASPPVQVESELELDLFLKEEMKKRNVADLAVVAVAIGNDWCNPMVLYQSPSYRRKRSQ
jgi:hypothetical protein